MTKSKEFTIRLDPETQAQVEDYLARTGVSMSVFAAGAMRAAIDDAEASDQNQAQALAAAQREAASARTALSEATRALARVERRYGL
ncbi:hypothetical protein [Lacticaseibacillus kribbianus]|uniref:hypothetical protein n=1 Tax=Lacticaseibacillus kribbianus TaxID=2926292 RepID=UPI001CD41C65|nr:hypothetical protein [Lacticaseibacillus kribbianus]